MNQNVNNQTDESSLLKEKTMYLKFYILQISSIHRQIEYLNKVQLDIDIQIASNDPQNTSNSKLIHKPHFTEITSNLILYMSTPFFGNSATRVQKLLSTCRPITRDMIIF